MSLELSVNVAYESIYDDYETVHVEELLKDVPTKMALTLVCHYTAQIHSVEEDMKKQSDFVHEWTNRFSAIVRKRVEAAIVKYNKDFSHFSFINNVSSLYLIEFLLAHHNDLPLLDGLTAEQEENIFKAYLYFSSFWTKRQEEFFKKNEGATLKDFYLPWVLPVAELAEFKDFRIQFIKAVYFFKFCEANDLFKDYLEIFLKAKGVETWQDYLRNLVSVYANCLQTNGVKTVIDFKDEKDVMNSLENFCVDVKSFQAAQDFLTLREKPLYKYSETELLFLNFNFFVDKIYQSILFDFADALIKAKATYKGNVINSKPKFIGIYGDEFIETGLFYKVMKFVFRQKDYTHFTGSELANLVGNGTPDYLIIDNKKLYVFEFKNALFSGPIKHTFDNTQVHEELTKKLVRNEKGKPKGVTQLVNFLKEVENLRYKEIFPGGAKGYIFYPIIVTTDFTFDLSFINSFISKEFNQQVQEKELNQIDCRIQDVTIMNIDSVIKFQDLFIERKLTLNHVLLDYRKYLQQGKDSTDKALSFSRYLHDRTSKMKYDTPKIFFDEIKPLLKN